MLHTWYLVLVACCRPDAFWQDWGGLISFRQALMPACQEMRRHLLYIITPQRGEGMP